MKFKEAVLLMVNGFYTDQQPYDKLIRSHEEVWGGGGGGGGGGGLLEHLIHI